MRNNNIINFNEWKKSKENYMSTNKKESKDINPEKKKEIEKEVDKIICNGAFKNGPTIDIVELVKSKGFLLMKADLPIEVTGYLVVNENNCIDKEKKYKKMIVVNSEFTNRNNESHIILKKSRFVTAHEYGHYILHKKTNESLYAHRDIEHQTSPKELEADYFARSLLMPRREFLKINEIIDETLKDEAGYKPEMKLKILSELFNVTLNKAKMRLGDIGVLASIVS